MKLCVSLFFFFIIIAGSIGLIIKHSYVNLMRFSLFGLKFIFVRRIGIVSSEASNIMTTNALNAFIIDLN